MNANVIFLLLAPLIEVVPGGYLLAGKIAPLPLTGLPGMSVRAGKTAETEKGWQS